MTLQPDLLDRRLREAHARIEPGPPPATTRARLEALLADAQPRTVSRPPRRSPSARRAVIAATTVTATLCFVAFLSLSDGGPSRGSDVATAAVKALSPNGSILHVVTQTTQEGPDVADGTTRSELWLAPDGQHGRSRITAADGSVLSDSTLRPVSNDAGLFDPIATARAMLKDGSLVAAGEQSLDGRNVKRFTDHGGETTLYLDADTLEPVRGVTTPPAGQGRFTAVTDYLHFERLDNDAENRALLIPPKTINPDPRPPGAPRNEAAPARTTTAARP